MRCSSLIALVPYFLINLGLPLTTAQVCNWAANFTANGTYGNNRNLLLASLASNVTVNGGFYTTSLGQGNDTVYALALCRGDMSSKACFNCVDSSSEVIMSNCPNQKEAVTWGDEPRCIVRCSHRLIFGAMEEFPAVYVWNMANITVDGDEFSQTLGGWIDGLVVRASMGSSRLKFATGDTLLSNFERIYGLMQCTPDLGSARCSECLRAAVSQYRGCCDRKRAATVLTPSCIFQYDLSRFYNSTANTPPPLPPSPPQFSPPPLPSMELETEEANGRKTSSTVVIIVVPITVSSLLIAVACAFLQLRRPKQENGHMDESESEESLRYAFDTIRAATNDFSDANKLGKGGFGFVYKGRLANGQEIAVKRLGENTAQGEVEFKNEIVLMAKLQHRNLVRLLGFCLEGKERLLIYEFMPNASLDRYIFDPIRRLLINWERRYRIIIGIAQGILYLHEDSQLRIIHRDLKAGNVLLDGEMNPKIADFGMARLFAIDQSKGNTRRIVGTFGYMAPEYARFGQFSVKTDVFSFGVLILEIVSGKKNSSYDSPEHVDHLLTYAWENWKKGTLLNLICPTLRGESRSEQMRCIHIGLLCVQENVMKRPAMASVVLMLNGFSTSLPLPSKPAFLLRGSLGLRPPSTEYVSSGGSASDQLIKQSAKSSVNEASNSEPLPR